MGLEKMDLHQKAHFSQFGSLYDSVDEIDFCVLELSTCIVEFK